jgi:hypothetical protein
VCVDAELGIASVPRTSQEALLWLRKRSLARAIEFEAALIEAGASFSGSDRLGRELAALARAAEERRRARGGGGGRFPAGAP